MKFLMYPRRLTFAQAAFMLSILVATCLGIALRSVAAVRATGAVPAEVLMPTPGPGVTISHEIPGGIHFAEVANPGMLPDGHPVVGRERAIVTAESVFNAVTNSSDAKVTALFGYYTDDHFAKVTSGGQKELLLQNRPVWFVEFTNLDLPGVGGMYEYLHPGSAARNTNHEQDILVDAVTGQYLIGITYR